MKKNKLFKIILIVVVFLGIQTCTVFADVGDFESYSSGSSSYSGGSSWSSSGSSSRWDDDDYYYSGSGSSSLGRIDIIAIIIIVVVLIIVFSRQNNNRPTNRPVSQEQPESEIINKIKEQDENFNSDEFKSWARDLFIKLQYAWADRNWEVIRCFETNELYEQHSTQLQRYVQNKQINKIERVSVNWVKLINFEQSGDKDVLNIVLNSKMIDYIIDETTGNVIKGDKETQRVNSYKLTFIRKTGVKTKPGTSSLNVTNCPNCGAPTEITSAGKCSYCGSIITTGEHNWVLSNLERYIY